MTKKDHDEFASNWDRIRKLFDAAMRQPPDERRGFLEEQCRGDDSLRDAVLQLVEAADRPGNGPEGIVGRAAEALAADRRSRDVGNYRLVELIGEGGMGRVYLAERKDEQYQQRVAIKILSMLMPGEHLLKRFRAERQILANLNHPYVARLLDGGETPDGLPFLVMEYVEGVPILEYCDRERLDLESRLRLFIEVCEAVQHAHRNLVVHRDLKSGNIFIAADGHPRLLDFGIAKLLEPDDAPLTVAETVAHARFLTPANASPEQVTGGRITVATDVYSLGLLLYELLTGRSAYGRTTLEASELHKAICEAEPDRPSQGVTQAPAEAPHLRRSTLDRLRKTLAGDLDTIVLKALRKNPDNRYASARELAEDVERYLKHQPLRARPPSRYYRARKFLRRNLVPVGAASLVALLLTGFTAITVLQNQRIVEERDTATRVSDFLVEIFNLARPEESPGETVTAKQVLDSGYQRIRQEFADQPRIKARLLWVMGESYASLGLHDDARILLAETADLGLEGHLADDDLVDVLANLAQEYSYLEDFDEATRYLDLAEAVYARLEAPDAELGKIIYMHHANHLRRQGRMEEGLAKLREAERIARTIEDDVNGHYPTMLHELGAWHLILGNYQESERWLRRALEFDHPARRERTNRRAVTLGVLGSTLRGLGRLDEALETSNEALEILVDELGPAHINVAITHGNIGRILMELERYDEAEESTRQALESMRATLGPDHSRVAIQYGTLARIRSGQGRYAEALELIDRSLEIKLKSLPEDHPSVASGYLEAGIVHRELGRHDRSIASIEKALGIFTAVAGPDSPGAGFALTELGITHFRHGDPLGAEEVLRRAIPILERAGRRVQLAQALRTLGEILVSRDRCAEGTLFLERSIDEYRDTPTAGAGEIETASELIAGCATRT